MQKTGRAEAALREMLDQLGEGARLPPERALCRELGVSRGTLRRALERHEARGRIWRHVGRGTFVGSAPDRPNASVPGFDIADPEELMELRLMLEPQIARLAAMRATDQQIAHMQYCVRKTGTVIESGAYELWDSTLHRALAEAANNKLLLAVFEATDAGRRSAEWGRLRDIVVRSRETQLTWWREHRAFVAAIADRDPRRAESAARDHVKGVWARLSAAAKSSGRQRP